MTKEDEVSLIERALYEGCSARRGSQVVASATWAQVITPGSRTILENGVFRSVLAESEAATKIEAEIARYRALGLPFWWAVTPSTRPADMESRLLARGFKPVRSSVGMIADLARVQVPRREGVSAEVVGKSNLDDWLAAQAEGWSRPPSRIEQMRRERGQAGQTEARIDLLLRVGGVVAGAGSVRLLDGFAHLFGGFVLPRFRGRGVFRTRVAAALELALAAGISRVTAHCSRARSAPIFAHFGFEEVGEVAYYQCG